MASASQPRARMGAGERMRIEEGLGANESLRSIAAAIGRAASSVSREVLANRDHKRLKDRGEPVDAQGCPRLERAPWVCNGCPKRHGNSSCYRRRVAYDARRAEALSALRRSESRAGIDMEPERAERALAQVRDAVSRGLSPYQAAASMDEDVRVSPATIYDWIGRGYGGCSDLMLERKVKFKKRRRSAPGAAPRRPERRSHQAFLALPEDERGGCWEMDTVVGRASDRCRLLTLHHRPTRLQLYLPMADGTCSEVKADLADLRACAGEALWAPCFRLVLTDNGAEFSDWGGIGRVLGEREGEPPRPYYCDPMRSDQKGACEKNHTELRAVLPKGRSLEGLTLGDRCAAMSHVNSAPRLSLAGLSPLRAFRAAYGAEGDALLAALGVEELPAGLILLKPALVDRERARRGEPPLGA